MTQILVTKLGALNQRDKAKLRRSGVVAVEAEHPEDVRLLSPSGPELSGDDLLFAAIRAVNSNSTAQITLAEQMLEALERARAKLATDAKADQ